MSRISCPSCDKDDMVQKVTAIVEGETHQTSGYSSTTTTSKLSGSEQIYSRTSDGERYTGRGEISGNIAGSSSTSINSTQRSRLAEKLMPPPKPPSPIRPKDADSFLKVPTITREEFRFNSLLVDMPFAISILFTFLVLSILLKASGILDFIIVGILAFFAGSLVGLILSFIFSPILDSIPGLDINKKLRTKLKQYNQSLDWQHQINLQKYQQGTLAYWSNMMARWNHTFYCRRCDVVYIPGESRYVEPSRIEEIL